MIEIILARHGESEFSARGVANGDPSIGGGLTVAGRQQAEELGRWLAGHKISLGVTSEFARTRETLDIALAGRQVPRLVLPQLDDIRYGAFEGRPLDAYRSWAHELPITYVLDAVQGKPPAATAAHPGYAAPHKLSESDLRKAVDLLEAWTLEAAATKGG